MSIVDREISSSWISETKTMLHPTLLTTSATLILLNPPPPLPSHVYPILPLVVYLSTLTLNHPELQPSRSPPSWPSMVATNSTSQFPRLPSFLESTQPLHSSSFRSFVSLFGVWMSIGTTVFLPSSCWLSLNAPLFGRSVSGCFCVNTQVDHPPL